MPATDATSTTASAQARDGLTLLTRLWGPTGHPWTRLLLVHGIAEHSGRYERTGALFAAAGIEVHAFDLRGFGASDGRRAHIDRWAEYLDDVEDRLAAIPGDLPRVLMGHSMGGLVALDYVASGRLTPDLLVLSSPSIRDSTPAHLRAGVRMLNAVAPTASVGNRLRAEQLSRDPEVGAAYFADPLVVPRSTSRLATEAFTAMGRAGQVNSLPVPTFVTHGSADTIVPATSTEALGRLPMVERRAYSGLRHETLNEPEGPRVVADIVAWLRRQLREL